MLEITPSQAEIKTLSRLRQRYPQLTLQDSSLPKLEDMVAAEHQQTDHALIQLGIDDVRVTPPSQVYGVGAIHRTGPVQSFRYSLPVVEITGMPDSGKSSHIEHLLSDIGTDIILQLPEGAARIQEMAAGLKKEDPFAYTQVSDFSTAFLYTDAITDMPDGTELIIPERGMSERVVWRRAHFALGNAHPGFMEIPGCGPIETPMVDPAAIILLMCRPEVGQARKAVRNSPVASELLHELYRQYWRLHYELMQGKIKTSHYICIDAEQDIDEVYSQFRKVFDIFL